LVTSDFRMRAFFSSQNPQKKQLSDAMIALQLFDHRIPSAMASFDARRVEKAEQFILMNHLLLSVIEHVLPVLHLADGKP
jgi:hypothetical protein